MDKTGQIKVITHDGYRANERPKAVVLDGERLEVIVVEERWIATGVESKSDVSHGFVVRCRGGARFRLVYSEAAGWSGSLLAGPRAVS